MDWKFKRCPKLYITQDISLWITAYKMYKNGFLPNSGGWLQQTNKFIEIMLFIDVTLNNLKAEMESKNGR